MVAASVWICFRTEAGCDEVAELSTGASAVLHHFELGCGLGSDRAKRTTDSRRSAQVDERTQKTLLQAPDFDQGLGLSFGGHLQQLPREAHHRQLRVSVLVIDHHELGMGAEFSLQKAWRFAGEFLLLQFPQLPLPQSVAEQDEHHLSRDHIEATRMKVAQVVEAL